MSPAPWSALSAPCSQASQSGLWMNPVKGFGFFGALASGRVRLEGRLGHGTWMVGPPDMDDEADQHESDQEELVKQQVRCHDDVPFHDG